MKQIYLPILLAMIWPSYLTGQGLNEDLSASVSQAISQWENIPPDRLVLLDELADIVREDLDQHGQTALLFVCTHNSRRSQMAQAWAIAASYHYGLDGVKAYSGGTEATAFNPRAVNALRGAGFRVDIATGSDSVDNPRYEVRPGKEIPAVICFSKKYGHQANPSEDFIAVMVCSDADESCPLVAGADARVAIPYTDPKISDGGPDESITYATRSLQIASEMCYLMQQVASASE